jgi:hypothetical protein
VEGEVESIIDELEVTVAVLGLCNYGIVTGVTVNEVRGRITVFIVVVTSTEAEVSGCTVIGMVVKLTVYEIGEIVRIISEQNSSITARKVILCADPALMPDTVFTAE